MEDASAKVEDQEIEEKPHTHENKKEEEKKDDATKKHHNFVNQDVRLNNRIIDLRVPANIALMRLQSAVC